MQVNNKPDTTQGLRPPSPPRPARPRANLGPWRPSASASPDSRAPRPTAARRVPRPARRGRPRPAHDAVVQVMRCWSPKKGVAWVRALPVTA